MYDALAFVPQSIIGVFSDKYRNVNIGLIGAILLIISLLMFPLNINKYLIIVVLCLGNALIHVDGAETTLRTSKGKLSPSAIFVSGGSFGVITGKILAMYNLNIIFVILLALTIIPFIIYNRILSLNSRNSKCTLYNYHNKNIPSSLIIILTLLIIITRGYVGYGIPTSWNKTIYESILLYSLMGLGKALGGILSDKIGIRKTATLSTILSLPFLIIGDNNMLISLIGVMFFSMSMALTLGILVSVLKNNPGLAFGLTTIGLFLGTAPIFFIKITNFKLNIFIIIILTIICYILFMIVIKKEEKHANNI